MKKIKKVILCYSSSMTYLRKYANSNRDVEPRVYQELKEYNYWRNLYGCKWISIIIYLLIAIREIIIIDSFNVRNIFFKTISGIYCFFANDYWNCYNVYIRK